jgi:hypothetical protein
MSESNNKAQEIVWNAEVPAVKRVRINHSFTQKNGWQLSDTTYEYSAGTLNWQEMAKDMREAYVIGVREANGRNALGADID